ncbi:hypothetical protein CHUAL_010201 [Chamberlinius hualienensis]
MMAVNLSQALEQDPFDPEQFVERLAWQFTSTPGIKSEDGDFDPLKLRDAFMQTMKDLKAINEVQRQKIDRIYSIVADEEKKHWQKVSELQERNKAAVTRFQELDERINFVATKVVHLGDQLESVNTPRSRAVEAQQLMQYFAEFLGDNPSFFSENFSDSSQLYQAADIIHKLFLISQELPNRKFDKAKVKIAQKYDEIERALIEGFAEAYRLDNKIRMKEIAAILSQFKGYSQCVDVFIEESQRAGLTGKDIFNDVIPLCEKNQTIIQEVFTNPDQVMSKFVLNIYLRHLQEYIHSCLIDNSDSEKYLKTLFTLYSKTNKLSNDLLVFKFGSDAFFLSKISKRIFESYLESYRSIEINYLKDKCSSILQRYYDSKNHQKKQILSGGIHDFKRKLEVSLVSKTNIHIGPVENYGGETFLSEEVAINLLQETKRSFQRSQLLSKPSELSENAHQIIDILFYYLCNEHMDYAFELALQCLPLPEPKTAPELYFLDIIRQGNAVMHLVEKQFSDFLLPLVVSTSNHGICLQKKKNVSEQLEQKLDTGLDRLLVSIIGWIRFLLQTEQKKSDFKPESDEGNIMINATPACVKVVHFLESCIEKFRDSIDGKNVEITLLDMGTRFHRVVYEHLQQFQYNSDGAVCVIYDINEYKKCVQKISSPLLNSLFDTLYALCNLLVVKPANLKQVCMDKQLAGFDKSVILNFVQLRIDYKTSKIANQLKEL